MTQSISGDSRIIYVPVETRVRELDAKLLFSLLAATAGFQVVFGPKWLFGANVPRLPRGISTFKTLNKMDAPALRVFGKYGHVTVGWDEEGPGQILPENYLKGINDEAVGYADGVFAWGEHQRQVMAAKYPAAADRIKATGNPRFDLLRPEWRGYYQAEAEALRARHGRFILINTNFSFYNSWFEDKIGSIIKIGVRTGAFDPKDSNDMGMLQAMYTFEKNTFLAYTALLPVLSSAFPDHTIIVRPHPTEKQELWQERLASLPNVKALHEGSVIPWIMAAEAVIQNSCTTGVEALALDQPVVSYCKYDSPLLEWHLANLVCPRIRDDATLVDRLKAYTADAAAFGPLRAKGINALNHHIANLSGGTASESILKSMAEVSDRYEREKGPLSRTFELSQPLEDYPRGEYIALKFPPLSPAEMNAKVARFTALDPRLDKVVVTEVAPSCFHLRANG